MGLSENMVYPPKWPFHARDDRYCIVHWLLESIYGIFSDKPRYGGTHSSEFPCYNRLYFNFNLHFVSSHFIWVNYNNSLTWIARPIWGWFPISKPWFQCSVATWGRYNLPRNMDYKSRSNHHWPQSDMMIFGILIRFTWWLIPVSGL